MPIFTEGQLLSNIIKSKISVEEKLNILCCVNDNYAKQLINLMYSVRNFCDRGINLYVLSTSFSKDSKKFVKNKLHEINIDVNIKEVTIPDFNQGCGAWSLDMYLKIYAHLFLPNNLQKILYLDCDMLAVDDVAQIFKMDIEDVLIGVVKDPAYNGKSVTERCEKLEIKHTYFNSGLLYLNLYKIRQLWTKEYIEHGIKEIEKDIKFPDQDILNKFCSEDQLLFLDERFNYCFYAKKYNYIVTDEKYIDTISKFNKVKPVIVHYAGWQKPWKQENELTYTEKLFFECGKLTGIKEYTIKGKFKVCVYAIAKNESKFVNKWVDSMQEADEIYVMLDATTTDNTEELLLARGVHVEKRLIRPWRFDRARNESLKLVPKDADICVCTDLDEVFEPGWRAVLEEKWEKGYNVGVYKYWHNAGSVRNSPNIIDYHKIHSREGFYWKWIIHEYIVAKKGYKTGEINLDGILLKHFPDKKKSRTYTQMLENALKAEPYEIRYKRLLIEAYINENKIKEAEQIIASLERSKKINVAYNFCYLYKAKVQIEVLRENYEKAREYCHLVISKHKNAKWFYGQLGWIYVLKLKEYDLGIAFLKKCLEINEYIMGAREREWRNNEKIYNIISIAYSRKGEVEEALKWAQKAVNGKPFETSYIHNLELYQKRIAKKKTG